MNSLFHLMGRPGKARQKRLEVCHSIERGPENIATALYPLDCHILFFGSHFQSLQFRSAASVFLQSKMIPPGRMFLFRRCFAVGYSRYPEWSCLESDGGQISNVGIQRAQGLL